MNGSRTLVVRSISCALLALLTSCASGPAKVVGRPVEHLPVAIVLRLSPTAAQQDDEGGAAAMIGAVVEQLREAGVDTRIYASSDDNPPPPRIDLFVKEWSTGDRPLRRALGASSRVSIIAGVAHLALAEGYEVVCRVYHEKGTPPVFSKDYSGTILSSDADASAAAGESLGNRIVSDVLSAEPKSQTLR